MLGSIWPRKRTRPLCQRSDIVDDNLTQVAARASPGERLQGGRRQAFWIALALRREIDDPLGHHERGAVLAVYKTELMEHSAVRDSQPRYVIGLEYATLLSKHAGDCASPTTTVELGDCS